MKMGKAYIYIFPFYFPPFLLCSTFFLLHDVSRLALIRISKGETLPALFWHFFALYPSLTCMHTRENIFGAKKVFGARCDFGGNKKNYLQGKSICTGYMRAYKKHESSFFCSKSPQKSHTLLRGIMELRSSVKTLFEQKGSSFFSTFRFSRIDSRLMHCQRRRDWRKQENWLTSCAFGKWDPQKLSGQTFHILEKWRVRTGHWFGEKEE